MINIICIVASGIFLCLLFCKIIPYFIPELNPGDEVELKMYEGYVWIYQKGNKNRCRKLICKLPEGYLGWAGRHQYEELMRTKEFKTYQDILDFEEQEKKNYEGLYNN